MEDNELTFSKILEIHESNLEYARRMKEPKNLEFYNKTEDFWNGYIYASFKDFQHLKRYCKDGITPMRNDLTDEEKEKFDVQDGFPLCGIIEYRNVQIPVYDDDYGQSMFAIFNGQTINGGTYNIFPESEFEYMVDRILDLDGIGF